MVFWASWRISARRRLWKVCGRSECVSMRIVTLTAKILVCFFPYHHHYHHQQLNPLLDGILLEGFFSLISIQFNPSKNSLSILLVFCLPCLRLPFLGCHSITVTTHLLFVRCMTCPAHIHLFSFNYSQDVFNFGLLPNPWCSLLITSWNAKQYFLHSLLGTLKLRKTLGFWFICLNCLNALIICYFL